MVRRPFTSAPPPTAEVETPEHHILRWERLRATLGDGTYEHFIVATGATMNLPESVLLARDHIDAARHELNATKLQP